LRIIKKLQDKGYKNSKIADIIKRSESTLNQIISGSIEDVPEAVYFNLKFAANI
jgi:hypothetical protein